MSIQKWLLVAMTGLLCDGVEAQKMPLDSALLSGTLQWPSVAYEEITPDGAYAKYMIDEEPAKSTTLVVVATEGAWERRLVDVEEGELSADSRWLYYLGRGDSLWQLRLGSSEQKWLARVRSFRLWGEGNAQRLCYMSVEGELVVTRVGEGEVRRFAGVKDYTCSEQGRSLVLQYTRKRDSVVEQELAWVDWPDDSTLTIWRGSSCGKVVFDMKGEQIAFNAAGDSTGTHCIWYCRRGMAGAMKEIEDHTIGIDAGLFQVGGADPSFSRDGSRLNFSLQERPLPPASAGSVRVDVWNWRDVMLQSSQLQRLGSFSYAAVKAIGTGKVIRLQEEGEVMAWAPGGRDEQAVAFTLKGDEDCWWNPEVRSTFYRVSTVDGSRQVIREGVSIEPGSYLFRFSPDGTQLIWYDNETKGWYRYDDRQRRNRRIGLDIPYPLYDKATMDQYPRNYPTEPYAPAGWLEGCGSVLLYDEYDIWQVDLLGSKASVCITGGYGRRQGIKLRIAAQGPVEEQERKIFHPGDTLLLSAFNPATKDNGFYRQVLGIGATPERLFMGPFVLYAAESQLQRHSLAVGGALVKARDTGIWLVRRQSATEAPNYYITRDFKNYQRLSDVHPERRYGWLATELVKWKLPNGQVSSGILYKPESFDPAKKYPLIIHYYEHLSDNLHDFLRPNLCNSTINEPYFVSHGYLVFEPDMHYRVGYTGQSVVDVVVSAAQYLQQRPYVDGRHMGINGHSYGGFETNYLVTHTGLFAAAAEAAGPTDLISAYGALTYGYGGGQGSSTHRYYETLQGRIGATLWEHPELYLENSPVLRADRISTPLLMMHNVKDGSVAFSQAVELFTALRRLRRPVWLLQYDEGGHAVFRENDKHDYTIRLTQFFDHYLKGAAAPLWMTQGVPARMKGLQTGLALDPAGSKP